MAKGRTLHFPSGSKERPTSDFLRETLFNLLGPLQNKTFLDLFAGSGSVGLEAASRGAQGTFFVEKNKHLVEVIKKNIQTCCLDKNCRIIAGEPGPRPADFQPLLPGYLHPPRSQAQHDYYDQHCVFGLGQHPLQHHHRGGHRRPIGGELRDFSVGGRKPA